MYIVGQTNWNCVYLYLLLWDGSGQATTKFCICWHIITCKFCNEIHTWGVRIETCSKHERFIPLLNIIYTDWIKSCPWSVSLWPSWCIKQPCSIEQWYMRRRDKSLTYQRSSHVVIYITWICYGHSWIISWQIKAHEGHSCDCITRREHNSLTLLIARLMLWCLLAKHKRTTVNHMHMTFILKYILLYAVHMKRCTLKMRISKQQYFFQYSQQKTHIDNISWTGSMCLHNVNIWTVILITKQIWYTVSCEIGSE